MSLSIQVRTFGGDFSHHTFRRQVGPLSWRTVCQVVSASRPISRDGVRPADVPRELARYRRVSSCPSAQAVPYGHSGHRSGPQLLIPGQRTSRLRIDADFARALIRIALPLYPDEDLGFELDNTVVATHVRSTTLLACDMSKPLCSPASRPPPTILNCSVASPATTSSLANASSF